MRQPTHAGVAALIDAAGDQVNLVGLGGVFRPGPVKFESRHGLRFRGGLERQAIEKNSHRRDADTPRQTKPFVRCGTGLTACGPVEIIRLETVESSAGRRL